MTPTVGAIVIYLAGDGYSQYGHCAKVEVVNGDGTFLVTEMNYAVWNDYDQRTSNLYDVECFILPPGVQPGQQPAQQPGQGGASADDVRAEWGAFTDYYNREIDDQKTRIDSLRAALRVI